MLTAAPSDEDGVTNDETDEQVVERLAASAQRADAVVAVAESLTGGQLAAALAAGPGASAWFAGGVVAYSPSVKFRVLDVAPGPVVTRRCAEQMARGVARLTGARASVAVTGVGGPDPEEDEQPGTVWLAWCVDGEVGARCHHFDGEPADVLRATVSSALRALADACDELSPG